jgi:hypothetical protein
MLPPGPKLVQLKVRIGPGRVVVTGASPDDLLAKRAQDHAGNLDPAEPERGRFDIDPGNPEVRGARGDVRQEPPKRSNTTQ